MIQLKNADVIVNLNLNISLEIHLTREIFRFAFSVKLESFI